MSKVSDSLGGKGVLWELFSFNPPTLQPVRPAVRRHAVPGRHPDQAPRHDRRVDGLAAAGQAAHVRRSGTGLEDLLRGAEDIEPILHGFKNSLHLRVGVRDILGKEDIRNTHRALSDIAEVCLKAIAQREYEQLVAKYGRPTMPGGEREGEPCEYIILALGKLGGHEPNYHSDLDVVFLYEADGTDAAAPPQPQRRDDDQPALLQPVGPANHQGDQPVGPLRPAVRIGPAAPADRQERFAGRVAGRVRPILRVRAGPAVGTAGTVQGPADLRLARARDLTMQVVRQAIVGPGWQPGRAEQIRAMRQKLEETASSRNLKRGPGGTMDVEFGVQLLQLKHAADVAGRCWSPARWTRSKPCASAAAGADTAARR